MRINKIYVISLGIYSKPIVLFDVEGYYKKLFEFTSFSVQEGFLPPSTQEDFFISDSLEDIFDFIDSFEKRNPENWLKRLGR